jgi:glycosyltransferase involved in cell wall biosynthesis
MFAVGGLMTISGFTLIRNGIDFDYPYLESLNSLLPLVSELVINVGIGDDNTLASIRHFAKVAPSGKSIKIIESDWHLDDPAKKKSGLILSEQTNLALEHCTSDWCIYLQADEVIHEEDGSKILESIEAANTNKRIEGLVFDYLHFYGSYNVIQHSRSTYRREVRAIRKSATATSVGDAQSFRKKSGEKLKVARSGAKIYHYGWVRSPEAMKEKTFFLDQLYHGDPSEENAVTHTPHTGDNYRYKKIWGLQTFRGTHPKIMVSRIKNKGWNWDLEGSPYVFSWKDLKRVLLDSIEKLTGLRLFEYKSYRLLRISNFVSTTRI